MHSALIIGADSTIGGALAKKLATSGVDIHGTTRGGGAFQALDLSTNHASWPDLPGCEVAYLCAAVTKLESCENDPRATRLVNVGHMQELATRLKAQGTFLVFLSSNQVFDGNTPYPKATDAPCPRNEYGRQKAEFESWLLGHCPQAAVLRLTKVISGPLPLLAKWEQALRRGETIEAFNDLVFAPLPLASVLAGLEWIGKTRETGIYQLSGAQDISYHGIACELAKRLDVSEKNVVAASAQASGIPAIFLPKHGTLDRQTLAHIAVKPALEAVFG